MRGASTALYSLQTCHVMRTEIQRYATFLLAVFTVGALVLPFAHEFTHVGSLESDRSETSVGLDGMEAVDLFVEERTVRTNPNCELCARITLDAPRTFGAVVPFRRVDDQANPDVASRADCSSSSRQIRAPPAVS